MGIVAEVQAELLRQRRPKIEAELRSLRRRELEVKRSVAAGRLTERTGTLVTNEMEYLRKTLQKQLTTPPKLSRDDRLDLEEYESWQEHSTKGAYFGFEFCQRMSAIDVGHNLGLIDGDMAFFLREEAIYEQHKRERAKEVRSKKTGGRTTHRRKEEADEPRVSRKTA